MKRVLKLAIIGLVLLNVVVIAIGVAFKRMIRIEDDPLGDDLSLAAITTGLEFESRAAALSHARIIAYAGGAMIDFSEAELDPDGLEIEVTTIMGGVDITVPRDCRIVLEATTFMGGTEGAVPEAELPEDAPEVRVRCTTIMGGLLVHYPEEQDEEPAAIDEQPEPQPIASA